MHSHFLPVATAIDNLGWDCFVEGGIPYLLIKTVQPMLQRDNPRGLVDLWGLRFIKSLISIMHKQWLHRNSNVHQEGEGLNAKQHQELTSRIKELILMKKESLLKRHQHLMDVDFLQLGSGPTIMRQVWVENVEMAISVAKVAWGNFCSQEVIKVLRTPPHGKPQYQEQTQPCLLSPHATSQTQKTTIRATPGSLSRPDHLSRPPYHRIRPAHQTNSPANHLVLYPMFIHPPRIPMSKGLPNIYPLQKH